MCCRDTARHLYLRVESIDQTIHNEFSERCTSTHGPRLHSGNECPDLWLLVMLNLMDSAAPRAQSLCGVREGWYSGYWGEIGYCCICKNCSYRSPESGAIFSETSLTTDFRVTCQVTLEWLFSFVVGKGLSLFLSLQDLHPGPKRKLGLRVAFSISIRRVNFKSSLLNFYGREHQVQHTISLDTTPVSTPDDKEISYLL